MKKDSFREEILENQKRFLKRLGNIIKQERVKQGISREKLSERLNISSNYIGYIEQGRYNLSLLKFILVINELGLNPNFVILNSMDDINLEEKDISKEILYMLKN